MHNTMLFISIDPIEYRRRVLNEIETAKNAGFQVSVISTTPVALIKAKYDFDYREIRIPKMLTRGVFRYPVFNFILLLKILFRQFGVIHFRGIIPIPAILIRQTFNKSILIYDAHEYFRGHQVFEKRPVRKAIWLWFEQRISRRLDYLLTVSEPLGELFKKDYPAVKNVEIIRSLPLLESIHPETDLTEKAKENKIALFHGYFLPGRGLENIITAFSTMKDETIRLLLIGEGPLKPKLMGLVMDAGLSSTVEFIDFIPNEELIGYIRKATIGLSIIQADCLNRKYALPNKFFEYIHAGLPVLASNIPTLQAYMDKYQAGRTVDPEDSGAIAGVIAEMISDSEQIEKWKANCLKAAEELNWQKESNKLKKIYLKLYAE